LLIYLTSGIILGITAGVAPGPLLTLVISQTMTYGIAEGIKVALAPLITDLPIIVLSIFIGRQIAANPAPLGLLSLVGAGYICYLSWESLNIQRDRHGRSPVSPKSIQRGIITNIFNPHPYMFWITVGTPLLLKTWAVDPWLALLWLMSFYGMLVGAKIVLSCAVGRSRRWFFGRGYLLLNRVLGLLLLFFAIVLAKDGLRLLGLWTK